MPYPSSSLTQTWLSQATIYYFITGSVHHFHAKSQFTRNERCSSLKYFLFTISHYVKPHVIYAAALKADESAYSNDYSRPWLYLILSSISQVFCIDRQNLRHLHQVVDCEFRIAIQLSVAAQVYSIVPSTTDFISPNAFSDTSQSSGLPLISAQQNCSRGLYCIILWYCWKKIRQSVSWHTNLSKSQT